MKKFNEDERDILQFGKGGFGSVNLIFEKKSRKFYAVK